MIVIKNRKELQNLSRKWRGEGLSIGLVPTMGYLHEGHESLIKRARVENDRVIVSDFVNPTQFGPNEDLATYPRDFDMDSAMCERNGVDVIFHPEPSDMYDDDTSTGVHVSGLTAGLCGKSRPTHFDGVCQVVNKLFNLSLADRGYFGQKDAQQLAVIRRMVRDLDMPIEIVGCPIIREEDGLAKSSRNVRLTEAERTIAPRIQMALKHGESLRKAGETKVSVIKEAVCAKINENPEMTIDYVEIVSWDSLTEIEEITGPVLLACAVRLGAVRLIDNIIME